MKQIVKKKDSFIKNLKESVDIIKLQVFSRTKYVRDDSNVFECMKSIYYCLYFF